MDLPDLRAQIDDLDTALLDILERRFAVGDEVGRYKAEHGLPPRDPQREATLGERYRTEAEARGLDPDVVEKVFRLIIDTTVERHQAISRSDSSAPGVSAPRPGPDQAR